SAQVTVKQRRTACGQEYRAPLREQGVRLRLARRAACPRASATGLLRLMGRGGPRRAGGGWKGAGSQTNSRRHSITPSARASSVGGTSMPSVFAVLRLITSSNLVGCSTGRSAGLAPFRILSTYAALRR